MDCVRRRLRSAPFQNEGAMKDETISAVIAIGFGFVGGLIPAGLDL